MKENENPDSGLETLLLLDREVYPMDKGYWIKIEARRVDASDHIQHGIRYSLTLHDRNNSRIFGIDKAEA